MVVYGGWHVKIIDYSIHKKKLYQKLTNRAVRQYICFTIRQLETIIWARKKGRTEKSTKVTFFARAKKLLCRFTTCILFLLKLLSCPNVYWTTTLLIHLLLQVIKPVNLEALTAWVGTLPDNLMQNMDRIAPMLGVLGYDPFGESHFHNKLFFYQ